MTRQLHCQYLAEELSSWGACRAWTGGCGRGGGSSGGLIRQGESLNQIFIDAAPLPSLSSRQLAQRTCWSLVLSLMVGSEKQPQEQGCWDEVEGFFCHWEVDWNCQVWNIYRQLTSVSCTLILKLDCDWLCRPCSVLPARNVKVFLFVSKI